LIEIAADNSRRILSKYEQPSWGMKVYLQNPLL